MTLAQALAAAGLEPREARLLLAAAAGLPEASVLAHPQRPLSPEAERRFAAFAERRRAGEPVPRSSTLAKGRAKASSTSSSVSGRGISTAASTSSSRP